MNTNPFEDENAQYQVLVNAEGQYSLWPGFHVDVPVGWTVAYELADRQSCLDWIEANWVDMRPRSLIAEMQKGSQDG